MPDLCELITRIPCRGCDKSFDPPAGVIRFQWGEVPRNYRVGDPVRWLTDRSGEAIPAFRLVGLPARPHWNYGDPAFREVLAFDGDPHEPPFVCQHCGTEYEAVAARVELGRFVGGVAFLPGEVARTLGSSRDEFEVATRGPDGIWLARTDWSNPVLTPFHSQ